MNKPPPHDPETIQSWAVLIASWLLDMTDGDPAAAQKLIDKVEQAHTNFPDPDHHEFDVTLITETRESIDDLAKSPGYRQYRP